MSRAAGFVRVIVLAAVAGCVVPLADAGTAPDVPWWKQGKINFMWGLWGLSSRDMSHPMSRTHPQVRPVPRQTFHNAALAGTTVFADLWQYNPRHARLAKEFGLRYFSSVHLHHLTWKPGGRLWINEKGEEQEKYDDSPGHLHRCPLDEFIHERWLAPPPVQEGIREGIVDGIHVDWESTEAGACYGDVCFAKFLERQNIQIELPDRPDRFPLIENRGLTAVYERDFHEQRVAMLTRIREKLQAVNPQLLFSSYGTVVSDFTRAVHTPEAPFLYLDARHYYNDDRQPWWESYSRSIRDEGYLYIAGGWTNALFGAQPSQVSAARWIYEAMIHEDGVWLWFEHELTDEVLTAYASADRKVREREGVVGDFLLHGRRDATFVTSVEWTGNPLLAQAAKHRTYRLDGRYLVHVSNGNADWPLRVKLRFPRVADGAWAVTDPVGGACYTPDGKATRWTTDQLRAGLALSLDARGDLFVLLTPAAAEPAEPGSRLLHSRAFDTMYSHADAAAEVTIESSETLPVHGWRFRMDAEDAGIAAGWFRPETATTAWTSIPIEDFWVDNGGVGAGWYRRDVTIPPLPAEKRIYLHFGAVDEELTLWIDGTLVGEHDRGPDGWDKPFAMDVTGKLTGGRHHLALRVYNSAMAGGVWKPVSVLAAPVADAGTAEVVVSGEDLDALMETADTVPIPSAPGPGPLLAVTATRQMLSEGSSGHRCFVNNAILAAEAAGDSSQQLRHLRGHLWSPAFAPDGSRIAFVHDAGGRGQIGVMQADGFGAVDLSANEFCDRAPAWAPDGSRIAFISDRTGDWDLYVMNSDGSGQRRLAGNPGLDCAPAWAPDGESIAWESHTTGTPNIWVCDRDGQRARPLIAADATLTVRAGKTGGDGVFAFAPVDWPFADNTVYLTDPAWSPDGSRIAARALGEHSGVMAVVIDRDGTDMLKVIGWIGTLDNLGWSPDGTLLAGTLRTAPQETDRSGVFVVRADGTEPYRWIVDVRPQGPRVTTAIRRGVPTWYAHGSAMPRRLLRTFTGLTWAPDGNTLAFSADLGPSGAFHVYTVPVTGGDLTTLDATTSVWPNEITWRPAAP